MNESETSKNCSESVTLDASGWLCPQPIIEARRLLENMHSGEVLLVTVTDPHGPLDMQVFCERSGHRLVSTCEDSSTEPTRWNLRVRKA